MTRRYRLLAWTIAGVLLAVYIARHLTFVTDITNFMPDGSASELAGLSRELAHSDLARTMVLTIGGPEPARAVAAAKQMAEALRGHPEVAWLRSSADDELQRRTYELYFPRRFYFLSEEPEQLLTPRVPAHRRARRRRSHAPRVAACTVAAAPP